MDDQREERQLLLERKEEKGRRPCRRGFDGCRSSSRGCTCVNKQTRSAGPEDQPSCKKKRVRENSLSPNISLIPRQPLPLDVQRRPHLRILIQTRKLCVQPFPLALLLANLEPDLLLLLVILGLDDGGLELGEGGGLFVELLTADVEVGFEGRGDLVLGLRLVGPNGAGNVLLR
jgi:hypothetical protein